MVRVLSYVALKSWIALGVTILVLIAPTSVDQPPMNSSDTSENASEHGDHLFGALVLRDIGHWIHENRDDVAAFSTAIIAAFTIILVIFNFSLSRSTRRAANAAKTSADASISFERPFLYIERIGYSFDKKPSADYRIANLGRTPAILHKTNISLRFLNELPPEFPIGEDRNWRDRVIFGRKKTVNLFAFLPKDDLLDTSEITAYINAGKTFFLVGTMIYSDVFGATHEAGFAFDIDFQGLGDSLFSRRGGNKYNYDKTIDYDV